MRYGSVTAITQLAAAAVVLVLAGCGGSQRPAAHVETIPSDGSFPAVTVTVYGNSTADCSKDADTFSSNARQFLAHEGPEAAYPADLYYLGMRNALRDFTVRACAPQILSRMLASRFTPRQLRMLLAYLPRTMAPTIRAALPR
jgi:hypothetical protein